jgi:hypothetical protein
VTDRPSLCLCEGTLRYHLKLEYLTSSGARRGLNRAYTVLWVVCSAYMYYKVRAPVARAVPVLTNVTDPVLTRSCGVVRVGQLFHVGLNPTTTRRLTILLGLSIAFNTASLYSLVTDVSPVSRHLLRVNDAGKGATATIATEAALGFPCYLPSQLARNQLFTVFLLPDDLLTRLKEQQRYEALDPDVDTGLIRRLPLRRLLELKRVWTRGEAQAVAGQEGVELKGSQELQSDEGDDDEELLEEGKEAGEHLFMPGLLVA